MPNNTNNVKCLINIVTDLNDVNKCSLECKHLKRRSHSRFHCDAFNDRINPLSIERSIRCKAASKNYDDAPSKWLNVEVTIGNIIVVCSNCGEVREGNNKSFCSKCCESMVETGV